MTSLAGALAAPLAGEGQQGRIPRVSLRTRTSSWRGNDSSDFGGGDRGLSASFVPHGHAPATVCAEPEKTIRRAKPGPGRRPLVHGELLTQGQVLEGELAVATDDEGEEPKQVEQEGDHRAGILSGSRG